MAVDDRIAPMRKKGEPASDRGGYDSAEGGGGLKRTPITVERVVRAEAVGEPHRARHEKERGRPDEPWPDRHVAPHVPGGSGFRQPRRLWFVAAKLVDSEVFVAKVQVPVEDKRSQLHIVMYRIAHDDAAIRLPDQDQARRKPEREDNGDDRQRRARTTLWVIQQRAHFDATIIHDPARPEPVG